MSLTFDQLSKISARRCAESFPTCKDWTAADWGNALAGEVGEACNLIKKLRRGDAVSPGDIAKELADVVTYADLVASFLGLDLGYAVVEKFNEVSERVGSPLRLDHFPVADRCARTHADAPGAGDGTAVGSTSGPGPESGAA